jgi:hypothetical protein
LQHADDPGFAEHQQRQRTKIATQVMGVVACDLRPFWSLVSIDLGAFIQRVRLDFEPVHPLFQVRLRFIVAFIERAPVLAAAHKQTEQERQTLHQ